MPLPAGVGLLTAAADAPSAWLSLVIRVVLSPLKSNAAAAVASRLARVQRSLVAARPFSRQDLRSDPRLNEWSMGVLEGMTKDRRGQVCRGGRVGSFETLQPPRGHLQATSRDALSNYPLQPTVQSSPATHGETLRPCEPLQCQDFLNHTLQKGHGLARAALHLLTLAGRALGRGQWSAAANLLRSKLSWKLRTPAPRR